MLNEAKDLLFLLKTYKTLKTDIDPPMCHDMPAYTGTWRRADVII
jgi:hypothetical protein